MMAQLTVTSISPISRPVTHPIRPRVKLRVQFTFPDDYPDIVPEVTLEPTEGGIDDEEESTLLTGIQEMVG